jgi:hypothetical protein
MTVLSFTVKIHKDRNGLQPLKSLFNFGFLICALYYNGRFFAIQRFLGLFILLYIIVPLFFFDNVKEPKENRLGDEKMGFKIIMQELARERLAIRQSSYGI